MSQDRGIAVAYASDRFPVDPLLPVGPVRATCG